MKQFIFLLLLSLASYMYAQDVHYETISDISYRPDATNEYATERCKLDIYYPKEGEETPTVVWFHGGGLTGGSKYIPEQLKQQGLIVITVNYRLMPTVEISECLDDAAAAVAWAFQNVENYGGDKRKIFISGHSAGGYLTAMIGLDKQWLENYGINADSIAGLIPFSGQMISHFAYREKKGIGNLQPLIDEYAPLFHVRKDAPPFILIAGDREQELFGRYEENAYMWRMMKLTGHTQTFLYEIGGHGHGPMEAPAYHILLQHIKQILTDQQTNVK